MRRTLATRLLPAYLACALIGSAAVRAQDKPAQPLLIDSHMHVWSDDPVRFPFAHPYNPTFVPPKIAASLQILVKEIDDHGVRHCVLVQTISHGWDNSYLVHCLQAE